MSSKRNVKKRSCTSKTKYGSSATAYAYLRKIGKMGELHVYKCKFCKSYHVGHPTKGQKSMKRALGYPIHGEDY